MRIKDLIVPNSPAGAGPERADGGTTTATAAPRGGRLRLEAAGITGAAVLSALVFVVVHRSLIDDSYITLSYARNLAEQFHWGLTPYRTANSATSPLNVLVLGGAAFVARDPVWGLGLVFVLLNAIQAAGLFRLCRALDLPRTAAVATYGLVLFSPLMLSIVGMEMTLAYTLVVWLTVAAAEGRPVLFGALSAALMLTRIDLLVFPVVLLLFTRAVRRRALRVTAIAVAVATPWYVFSWIALGALLPDTLVIKTLSTGAWGDWYFGNGPLLFWQSYPAATLLSALPALLGAVVLVVLFGVLAVRRERRLLLSPLVALGVAGAGHYLAYTFLAPPPFHWYYAPSVTALTTVAVYGVAALVRRGQPGPTRAAIRVPTLAVASASAALLLAVDVGFLVQRGLPWERVPITTNWATAAEYQVIGEDMRKEVGNAVVSSPGEIGTLAYYCRCDIVDAFSDRGTLAKQVDTRLRESGPVMRWLLKLNYAHFARPPAAVPDLALRAVAPEDPTARWRIHSSWRGVGAMSLGAP